mmetsp:Transcript_35040/g.39848  ORF Transcript_35040/g.39848 Transcript_35040/m.39848 type:complete len:99 (+) Transcript_35040:302-598(+)
MRRKCRYMNKYTTADQAQYKVYTPRIQRRYMRWIERNFQSKSQPKALMAVEFLAQILRVQLTSVEVGTEENQLLNIAEASVLTASEALNHRFPTEIDR